MSNRLKTDFYNDNSLLMLGRKYHGCKLEQVPAWYLLWLITEPMADLNLREYIELNKEILEQEKAEGRTYEVRNTAQDYERKEKIRRQFRGKPMTTRPGDII